MTKRSASLTRKGRFSEYYFNRALAAADSIEYSPFDELSRNIERRMITDTIRVKILCKNSLFTKVNISEIARSTCGSQLFVVTAGTIDVYNANNFKRKIKNQHKREQIEEKDVLMKINQNGFATIYKDLKGELYLIEDDVNVLLSIKQRRFKRSETYFDTFRNEFAETDSCRCPECNAAEQHKRRTFLKRDTGKNLRWFTKSKRSRTTPFPSRPISLQSVNKTQYGVTVSNCIASPLSNTSYENERYPVIAQPSDQGAEESSYPFSIQRNTSTDGLSFYRPHYSGLPSRLSNTSSVSIYT